LTKISLIYSASYFNLGGAWSFVWGAKSTKAPRGDGTDFIAFNDISKHFPNALRD